MIMAEDKVDDDLAMHYRMVLTSELRKWTPEQLMRYFRDQCKVVKTLQKHQAEYEQVLEGMDGNWFADQTKDSLRAFAESKGFKTAFKSKLAGKKLLAPLGLGEYDDGRNSREDGLEEAPDPARPIYAAYLKEDYVVPPELPFSASNAKKIVEAMYARGIRLLCFDFDLTIVAYHTQGRWYDSAAELAKFVRPVCRELIRAAFMMGNEGKKMHIACTTLSSQEHIITEVFESMCGDLPGWKATGPDGVIMRVGGVVWKYEPGREADQQRGKHSHMLSSIMEVKAKRGETLELKNALLMDDDYENIRVADANGAPAAWFKARHLTEDDKKQYKEKDGWHDRQVCENMFVKKLERMFLGDAGDGKA